MTKSLEHRPYTGEDLRQRFDALAYVLRENGETDVVERLLALRETFERHLRDVIVEHFPALEWVRDEHWEEEMQRTYLPACIRERMDFEFQKIVKTLRGEVFFGRRYAQLQTGHNN